MSKSNYPTKLQTNIIVEAVFEIRFNAQKGFSDYLPGSARSRQVFGDVKNVERFPVADIPNHIRESDVNLRYQPILRVIWDDVMLVVGDHSLGLVYSEKYVGWDTFKGHIDALLEWLTEANGLGAMINYIERYSFKYVDFIPDKYYSETDKPFKVQAVLGGEEKGSDKLKLQLERKESFGVSIFEFMNPVQASVNDSPIGKGALISIDTVRDLSAPISLEDLVKDLSLHREEMHLKNKELFFTVLSNDLLENLGAKYE